MQTVGPSGRVKAFHVRVDPGGKGKRKERSEGRGVASPQPQDEAWRADIPALCLDQQTLRGWAMKTHAHERPHPELGEGPGGGTRMG